MSDISDIFRIRSLHGLGDLQLALIEITLISVLYGLRNFFWPLTSVYCLSDMLYGKAWSLTRTRQKPGDRPFF